MRAARGCALAIYLTKSYNDQGSKADSTTRRRVCPWRYLRRPHIEMLVKADHGLLFRPPSNVVEEFPQFPVVEDHADMLARIKAIISEPAGTE